MLIFFTVFSSIWVSFSVPGVPLEFQGPFEYQGWVPGRLLMDFRCPRGGVGSPFGLFLVSLGRPRVLLGAKSGAKSVTLTCKREWPLAETSAGAMSSSHYEGPGPSLFAPKLALGTHCAPGKLFFTLLAALLVPKRLQGRPRDIKKNPKGLPKPPRGHVKSIRN